MPKQTVERFKNGPEKKVAGSSRVCPLDGAIGKPKGRVVTGKVPDDYPTRAIDLKFTQKKDRK